MLNVTCSNASLHLPTKHSFDLMNYKDLKFLSKNIKMELRRIELRNSRMQSEHSTIKLQTHGKN